MKLPKILGAGLLALSSAIAQAEDQRFYAGVAAAFTRDDIGLAGDYGTPSDQLHVAVDNKGDGLKIFGGWQPARCFALELSYTDLGKTSRYSSHTTPTSNDTLNEERSVWAVDLSALAIWPIGGAFSLYGRGGAAYWDAEVRERTAGTAGYGGPTQSDTGVSPMAGLGVSFRFVAQGMLRVEYQRYFDVGGALRDDRLGGNDIGQKSDIDLLSISAHYFF